MVRIILADDHAIVRAGIIALLSRMRDVEVVAEAADGEQLLSLTERMRPDLIITDLWMPGVDGLTAIRELRAKCQSVRIMVLSMDDRVDYIKRAVASGVDGYLMKTSAPAELERAIQCVMGRGTYYGSEVAQALLAKREPSVHDVLTARQVEVLTLLARGRSSKEIARDLGVSPKTVDIHRSRMMERLKINDIAGLTRYAVRKGLVQA